MSGGSYNYLCVRDEGELLEGSYDRVLASMRDRLVELGHDDAAMETEQLLLTLRQSRVRVRVKSVMKRMSPVWKAVEWYDSADWGIDRVNEAVDEYRTGEKK